MTITSRVSILPLPLPLACSLLFAAFGCDRDGGGDDNTIEEWWQSSCVHDNRNLARTLPDGASCTNGGYLDCGDRVASECVNYCGLGICQAEMCSTDEECIGAYGADFECNLRQLTNYVDTSNDAALGFWCQRSSCPAGTLNCPCRGGDVCNGDPFVAGQDLSCENGKCRSACPVACQSGGICCGGALCSGQCALTTCC